MQVLDATIPADRLACEDKDYCLRLQGDTPFEKYPAKQHARRVQEKMGIEHGLIYLPGQPARNNEDSDMPAPFRQRRYFYYLSGCNEPNCHLVYDVRRDLLSLFIPRINPERVIWNGRGSTQAGALAKYDIDQVFYSDELQYVVQGWAHSNRHAGIYVLHPSSRVPGCDNLVPRTDFHSLQPAMNLCRMIKDSHEIGLIRKANDISSQAHEKVLENILSFTNEAQVEGIFMDVCISNQAKQQVYNPIAASGPNAGTLHYDANNESLKGRQLMCLDAGCEYELYASDITRTFPLSASWPSKEAANIYKLVERMQEKCIERLAPGVRYLDLHILAHQIAIDGLLQLGILHNGTKEEIYKAGTSRAFFPHGLGHHVGLEVHDPSQAELMSARRGKLVQQQAPSLYPENFHAPVYNSESCRAPADPYSSHLEEGMVVTVEPGIYFSIYALQNFYLPSPIHSKFINLQVLKRYLPVGGVRIEDDILITARGYENLTTAPKGEAMLHIIRQGKANGPKPLDRRTPPSRRQSYEAEVSLLRAPGIPKEMPQPIPKPLTRASTLPAKLRHQQDLDFEPSPGPSLFSNFAHSMTTEERIEQWREKHNTKPATSPFPESIGKVRPVCGNPSSGTQHIYMGDASSIGSLPRTKPDDEGLPACKNCVILVQTLDRLRKNLTSSTQSSPVPVAGVTESCAKPRTVETRREKSNMSTSHKEKVTAGTSTSSRDHRKKESVSRSPQHFHPNMSSTQPKAPLLTRRVEFGSPLQDGTQTSEKQPTSSSSPHHHATTQFKVGSPTAASPSSLPTNRHHDPSLVASWQLIESLQKKVDELQLGVSNLEERSRSTTKHPQPGLLPVLRLSMPNLMSHPL